MRRSVGVTCGRPGGRGGRGRRGRPLLGLPVEEHVQQRAPVGRDGGRIARQRRRSRRRRLGVRRSFGLSLRGGRVQGAAEPANVWGTVLG